jgi:tetratricopeptide (TPR) repeat protein
MRLDTLVLPILVVLSGCRSCDEPAVPAAQTSTVPPSPASSLVRTDLTTTSAEIALGNLDGQIKQLRRHVEERPNDVHVRASLAQDLRARSQIYGGGGDLRDAFDIGTKALADFPNDPDAKLLHVQSLAAVHRFREALAELDALMATPQPDSMFAKNHAAERASILQALGRYDEALPLLHHQVEVSASSANLDAEAILLGLMGRAEDADKEFVEAEAKFRDTSPFFLAALYFDRASLWEREGVLDRATELYRAAHERLPQHVHAASHLAALLPPKEAVAILEPLGHADGDPEVLAGLGVFRDMVKDGSGKAALDSAKTRYDELMKTLPEAYADHAGWFWLGAGGDPDKAFEAAKVNLGARETAESFELYLSAAAAAHHHDDACAVGAKARLFPYPSHRLTEQLRQLGDCGAPPAASASASAAASSSAAPASSAAPKASASVAAPGGKAPPKAPAAGGSAAPGHL